MIICGSNDAGAINYFRRLASLSSLDIVIIKNIIKKQNPLPKLIITGAALGEGIDKELIRLSKRKKITCISIIENWTWYRKRFETSNGLLLPDIIFLNDEQSKVDAANDGLPIEILKVMGNPIIENLSRKKIKNQIIERKKKTLNLTKNIIFISEQLKQDFRNKNTDLLGFDEYEVINDIIQILQPNEKLTIKLHPSENINKYSFLKNTVEIIDKCDIEYIINNGDVIIGMQSMLLIELAVFRQDIISYRPNAKTNFIGPIIGATIQAETIYELRSIIDKSKKINTNFFKNYIGSSKRIENFLNKLIK